MKSSSISKLSPMINDKGILVLRGRLSRSLEFDEKIHPILIPHGSKIASLIVRSYHESAHLGSEWTLSLIREKFWITRARSVIKSACRNCLICKKLFSKPMDQRMADLPSNRLKPYDPPFSHVGVDCFVTFWYLLGDLK